MSKQVVYKLQRTVNCQPYSTGVGIQSTPFATSRMRMLLLDAKATFTECARDSPSATIPRAPRRGTHVDDDVDDAARREIDDTRAPVVVAHRIAVAVDAKDVGKDDNVCFG